MESLVDLAAWLEALVGVALDGVALDVVVLVLVLFGVDFGVFLGARFWGVDLADFDVLEDAAASLFGVFRVEGVFCGVEELTCCFLRFGVFLGVE